MLKEMMDKLMGAVIIGPTEEHVDRLVKQIAYTRRQIQILDDPELLKRYDAHLKMCLDKWEKYFASMDQEALTEYAKSVIEED